MQHRDRSLASRFCWTAIFFAASIVAVASISRAQPRNTLHSNSAASQDKPGSAAAGASGYAGGESCKNCHGEIYDLYMKTKHRQTWTDTSEGPSKQGCEACHGPGAAHSEDPTKPIFDFKTGTPSERSARCLSCHNNEKTHEFDNSSIHKMMGVSCEECHDPHLHSSAPKDRVEPALGQAKFFGAPSMTEQNRWLNQSMLRLPQPALCFTCHRTVQAQFAMPTHHRVPEGLMKCSDCHNPHGTENRAQLSKPSWEACVTCHVEKRGPYIYEHASVKIEGCVACHNPHGSNSRFLLLRGESRFLCLQCHVDPQAINVPHGRLGFQTGGDCVRCHATIHGSNSNQFFLN